MKKVLDNKNCYNCQACFSACPKAAITMKKNNDGFSEAVIDENKCINCGLCYRICPALNSFSKNESYYENEVYAAFNKNEKVINASSSGGMFSVLCNNILTKKGIVCAPAFDENYNVKHIFVEKEEDLTKLYGSKYVESSLDNKFKTIKKYLDEKKYVLFSGTSCQVAGLKIFLKKDYDNLITQDVICHGIPTEKMWQKYLKDNFGEEKITFASFRNKINGWEDSHITIKSNTKEISNSKKEDPYFYFFIRNIALKKTCYECQFKNGNTKADITLGDFWGIENLEKNLNVKNGISMVIVNTEKGKSILNENEQDYTVINKYKLKDVYGYNPMIKYSVVKPARRQEFLDDLDKMSFTELKKKYELEPSKVNAPKSFNPVKLGRNFIGKILRKLKLRK